MKRIEITVFIDALPSQVWEYLTVPQQMKKWMGEPAMHMEVTTDWSIGNPILIKGFHHVAFENRGTVLRFAPPHMLQYSHLSSISQLPDKRENYSIITFALHPEANHTRLTLQLQNFPTESIHKHLHLYWQGTATILKDLISQEAASH